MLVIGTFHNPNWFYAHLLPITKSEFGEILLIGDGHIGDIEGLKVVVPHPMVSKVFSRAGAKFLYAFWHAFRFRPDIYMGYAIFPAATTCLILGALFRGLACFQITSGPLELVGGGYHAENRVLSRLDHPSGWIESLAFALTNRFDLLVVRGSRAETLVREKGYKGVVATITGSVSIPESNPPIHARPIDLIFVGRLTERKRPDRFIAIVESVARHYPNLNAAVVGDGPEMEAINEQIVKANLQDRVSLLGLRSDVVDLLKQSKIFVLTSRWEGVSIAMLESMACGTTPVASNVGDLSDVVRPGVNGYILGEDDLSQFADRIVELMSDISALTAFSRAARETIVNSHSREAIAKKWQRTLTSFWN